jgi:hypothetical protein
MHPWRRDKQAQEDPAFRQRFDINQHQMHSFVTISATSIWGVGNRNTVVPTPQCSVDSLSQVSQLQSHPLRTRTSLTRPSHGRCSRQSRTHHRHLTSLAQRSGSQETSPLFMKVGPYPSKKEKPKPNIHGCHHLVVEASHFNLGRVHHTGFEETRVSEVRIYISDHVQSGPPRAGPGRDLSAFNLWTDSSGDQTPSGHYG